jgi:TatD DNase family protein
MNSMLERARKAGLKSIIITGTSLEESRDALSLARELGMRFSIIIANFIHSHFQAFFAPSDVILRVLPNLINSRAERTRICWHWTSS